MPLTTKSASTGLCEIAPRSSVFAFLEAHRKRLRTSNSCENVKGQIKKRTRVVGLFPSEESLLRLVTGVLIEISETWETGKTYLTPS